MARALRPPQVRRVLALLIALVGVPLALSITVFVMDTPVRIGEPSPRTIVAPDLIRVPDPDATDRARRQAADEVTPIVVDDQEARAAILQSVRDAFAVVRDVRVPGEDGEQASPAEQVEAMRQRLPMLGDEALDLLVRLSDDELAQATAETVAVAREFARQRITEERVETVANEQLRNELVVRQFPPGIADAVADPLIRASLRPTVIEDEEATSQSRQDAADAVAEVVRTFPAFSVIVSAGEEVDSVQFAALRQRGLEGAEPWRPIVKAFIIAFIATAAVVGYLYAYRRPILRSSRRVLLLAVLFLGFALAVEAVALAQTNAGSGWRYVVPIGAIAMLATILFDPPIGVLVSIPAVVLVAFTTGGQSGPPAFMAIAALATVPLVTRLSSRGALRRAAWQSTLLYGALAGVMAAVFADLDTARWAAAAGLLNGVLTYMIVSASLPLLESSFKIVTATSLLDLADRNHPLLRELEQKALGSYNHSILVATLVERACRAIGADGLLGSTAALYHDIGKVRQPWFFVENQFGIANPHDELDPETSALIIQEHVTDGISMARQFRLPPEIVEGIATHHGTTLVSYFHRRAQQEAGPDGHVDEQTYRYKGRKPSSKEMAVLMLADCCEGASRAAALTNRNLSRHDLETICRTLIAERVDDNQLDESSLTFHELKVVTESFIETLTGVYHPRIAYPPPVRDKQLGDGSASAPAPRSLPPPDAEPVAPERIVP
jgi:cyclic-di-AMP phosphodiesterase PgpH